VVEICTITPSDLVIKMLEAVPQYIVVLESENQLLSLL